MGGGETTAQVHPGKLTHALLAAAEHQAGTRVLKGTVEGINLADDTSVSGERFQKRIHV